MNIILTGMMGAGKTTVGKRLAQKLNLEFLDLDEYIERKTHLKIQHIFSIYGESYFRKLEKKFCKEVAQNRNSVISTGGKTLLDKENLNSFSTSGIIITLLSSPEKILQRTQKKRNKRPLLASHLSKQLYKIYQERAPQYLNLPNRIDTTRLIHDKVIEEIQKLIRGEEKRFEMTIGEKESMVIVKRGILDTISSYIKDILQEKKAFILSDKKVFVLYGKKLLRELKKTGVKFSVFLIPPGESQKNLKKVERIYDWLLKDKATRASLFISFGGGVVSDLGGYVASTFHRGLNLVNIPTTLLSQIDASIGGKNSINLKELKNQIGTFYFPPLILIDPLFLVSLDHRQMKEGIIEALKGGVIADNELFQIIKDDPWGLLLKDMKLLEEVIRRAIKVKLKIVNQDPYEKKERRFLNFGHTFGHALESYFNYRKITHGQAVGLGMICACKMGILLNISSEIILSEIKNLLLDLKTPINLSNLDISKVISFMEYDKKRKEDKISFIIPKKIGEVQVRKDVSKNIVFESLKEISHG